MVGISDVVTNVLDCNVVRSEFELLSYYYLPFQSSTLRKGMKPNIP